MSSELPAPSIRVGIVDDHPAFRSGLRFMVSHMDGAEVVGEAGDGLAGMALVAEVVPDVVLVDLSMPGLNGIELTKQLTATHPNVAVLVLTMFDDDDSVFSAMRAGARGYLLKDADAIELERAIRAVAAGEAIFSPGVARLIGRFFASAGGPAAAASGSQKANAAPFPQLTAREREILDLVASGLSNGDIARRLYLSDKTVRNNVSTIFTKLQVANRPQAIVEARNAGLGQQPRA